MKYNYVSRDVSLTDSMKEKVEKTIGHYARYFRNPDSVVVTTRIEVLKNEKKGVEISLDSEETQLRAKVLDGDFYNAVDQIDQKLGKQMRKVKTILGKSKKKESLGKDMLFQEIEDRKGEEGDVEIVRRKTLSLAPMDVDEALARMDALGHNFFIYLDSTTGKVNVLYEREDHGYGVIEVENH